MPTPGCKLAHVLQRKEKHEWKWAVGPKLLASCDIYSKTPCTEMLNTCEYIRIQWSLHWIESTSENTMIPTAGYCKVCNAPRHLCHSRWGYWPFPPRSQRSDTQSWQPQSVGLGIEPLVYYLRYLLWYSDIIDIIDIYNLNAFVNLVSRFF